MVDQLDAPRAVVLHLMHSTEPVELEYLPSSQS